MWQTPRSAHRLRGSREAKSPPSLPVPNAAASASEPHLALIEKQIALERNPQSNYQDLVKRFDVLDRKGTGDSAIPDTQATAAEGRPPKATLKVWQTCLN